MVNRTLGACTRKHASFHRAARRIRFAGRAEASHGADAASLSVYASELLSTVMVKKGATAQAMPKTANAMTGS